MCSQVEAYLFSSDCTAHMAWLEKVFDAKVGEIHYFKDSKRVMHTCMSIGKGKIMMSDYMPGKTEKHSSDRGFAVSLAFDEGEGEKYWKRAVENGGKVEMEYDVQFWGSYFGSFVDPFGFMWFVVQEIKKSEKEKDGEEQVQKNASEKNGDEKYEHYLKDGPTGPK